MQNRLQNRPGVKSELFQELEDQCYPVLKLEDEIRTFAIVGGPKVDLTLNIKNKVFVISAVGGHACFGCNDNDNAVTV
jgi:hypothetical protein